MQEHKQGEEHFIFGKLSKYAPEGEVGVVDEATRSQRKLIEPNLLRASSPFVYIPEHSGISFLHVSGQIEARTFTQRFCRIIESTYLGFFVECDIDLVADLKTFAAKLSSLDGIFKLEARVSPPNPLFSPLWKSLEDYLRGRNTDRMVISEDAPPADVLNTKLADLVESASEQTAERAFVPSSPVPIGDAAILMAADGHGTGVVRGRRHQEVVVIRTSETALHFSFDKAPDPHDLYEKALEVFQKIKQQRHMEHGQ